MAIDNTGIVTTWRTLGAAALLHNLFTITNTHATMIVRLRRLTVQLEATAALTALMPLIKTCRVLGANPSGGTALTKGQFDLAQTPSGSVTCLGATATDGGGATAITAVAGQVLWQQTAMRMHSVIGQVLSLDNNLLTSLIENPAEDPLVLRQNEALVVQVVAPVTTSNPNTNHWFVQCVWEEFT